MSKKPKDGSAKDRESVIPQKKPGTLIHQPTHIAVGSVLSNETLMEELLHMVEELRENLHVTAGYKLLLDYQRHLNSPQTDIAYHQDHYQKMMVLCLRAGQLIAIARIM